MVKRENEDFVTYAGNVNRMCERFMLLDLSIDRFKCLVFVQGLTSSKDKDIGSWILTKLEQGSEVTLPKVTEECQRMLNLKWHDNTQIEEKDISRVHAIRPKTGRAKKNVKTPTCSGCGGGHIKSEFFCDKNCFSCGNKGNISAHCKSKRNEFKSKKDKVNIVLSRQEIEEEQKRKFVQVKINGKNVKLQLDTGSDISIVNTETWIKIGRPLLKKTEKVARWILGRKVHFQGEFSCNISFVGKTLKSSVYATKCFKFICNRLDCTF